MEKRQRQNMTKKYHKQHIEEFLEALVACGSQRSAARYVGISHSNHKNWMQRVPGYAERYAEAMKKAAVRVVPEARATIYQLGVEGVLEDVRDKQGNLVWDPVDKDGNVVPEDSPQKVGVKRAKRRVYNVNALLAVLRAHCPEEFGDKQKIDIAGKVDHTHRVEELSEDELRRIASQGRGRIAETN